jgi:hypothetical protein
VHKRTIRVLPANKYDRTVPSTAPVCGRSISREAISKSALLCAVLVAVCATSCVHQIVCDEGTSTARRTCPSRAVVQQGNKGTKGKSDVWLTVLRNSVWISKTN